MRPYFLLIALLNYLLLLGALPAAAGNLSGYGEWDYAQFEGKEDGRKVTDASHFTQQYSLLYRKAGDFLKGRAGAYDIAFGGEWNSLDSKVNGEDLSVDTFKVLYKGDVIIAPGGLPFRLHLFSQDLSRSRFLNDTTDADSGVIDPRIATDLENGQRLRTGATLLLGIRNGSYLGRYRDILSHFPRLLMDYREDYVRDLKSPSPVHFRQRNLAFVSLNKKDNWFHYRFMDYTDYLLPDQDYDERSFMLGTIDHALRRQWINLTNWIRISADGSFTSTKKITSEGPMERFDLNLFSVARRTKWEGATFTTFERILDKEFIDSPKLTKTLEVPFYLKGEFDRNTSWSVRFIGLRANVDDPLDAKERYDRDLLYGSTRFETFRQGRYILAPQFEGEVIDRGTRKGYGARAGVEIYSNRHYRPRYDLFGSYAVAYFGGDDDTQGADVDFLEQEVSVRVETRLNARLRTGLEESVILGTGSRVRSVTENIGPRGNLTLDSQRIVSVAEGDGDSFQSSTSWFIEHSTVRNFDNRISLTYDYLSTPTATKHKFKIRHHGRYDIRRLSFKTRNELLVGDEIGSGNFDAEVVDTFADTAEGLDKGWNFTHNSTLRYSPGRAWEGNALFDYNLRDLEGGSASLWRIGQSYSYNFFKVNGVVRKLAELNEEFEYERFQGISGETQSGTKFTLSGFYYPTRRLSLGAILNYTERSLRDVEAFKNTLRAALTFEKLKVHFDYIYGMRSDAANSPELEEHRWEIKIIKIL